MKNKHLLFRPALRRALGLSLTLAAAAALGAAQQSQADTRQPHSRPGRA